MFTVPGQLDFVPYGEEEPEVTIAPLDAADVESIAVSALDLLNSYAHIFLAAFLVTLLVTPLIRRLAFAMGVIDKPGERRKLHGYPVAYLGGVAIFLGLITAVALSYVTGDHITAAYLPVPLAVVIGMVAIAFTGLADDIWGWDPRLKIAGQLVAAAALAITHVGVRVAEGALTPIMGGADEPLITMGSAVIYNRELFYWTGTAIIGLFVLGGCNAANLLDGLDGLLSGVVGIVAVGLLAICLVMALETGSETLSEQASSLTGARMVLCAALLGAVLGFLPHNFNPATIFLGDCGSLLLGYMCVVIILMLGERGQTHLVMAGLIVFSVPIIDTTLAIIRRKLAGQSLSEPDDQHIHHQLLRALGGVKRAVFALYGIGLLFAVVGVTLAALVMRTGLRVRVIYAIALVLFSTIGVIAVKSARAHQRRLAAAAAAKAAARKAAIRAGRSRSAAGNSPPSSQHETDGSAS